MSFIIYLVVMLAVNFAISMLMSLLIPNAVIAAMASSIVISFLFSLFYNRKNGGIRTLAFWRMFMIYSIIFLITDCLTFIL